MKSLIYLQDHACNYIYSVSSDMIRVMVQNSNGLASLKSMTSI